MNLQYFVALGVLLAGATQQPRTHVLDLTTHRELRGPITSSGCSVGESGMRQATLPLEVALTLQRKDYVLGGHVIVDADLANTGISPVTLPWRVPGDGAPSDDLVMTLALETHDDRGKVHTLLATSLSASSSDQHSRMTLQPGDKARIRIPGWLTVPEQSAPRIADVNGTMRDVYLKIRLSVGECRWSAPLLSPTTQVLLKRNPRQ